VSAITPDTPVSRTSRIVTQARRALARMDRGERMRVTASQVRLLAERRNVPWLADHLAGPRWIWVYPDDRVTPAPKPPGAIE
jgi:hypothetical protein